MSRTGGTQQPGGVCPGGDEAGLPQGEGLCSAWLPQGPFPKNNALMRPRPSFGSGLEDVGLFCHTLEGIVMCLCRAGGRERMPGGIFREVSFF